MSQFILLYVEPRLKTLHVEHWENGHKFINVNEKTKNRLAAVGQDP